LQLTALSARSPATATATAAFDAGAALLSLLLLLHSLLLLLLLHSLHSNIISHTHARVTIASQINDALQPAGSSALSNRSMRSSPSIEIGTWKYLKVAT
jgi:hypothetical protein